MNDEAPRAGNAIRPFRGINKVVEAKNSSEFITGFDVGLCNVLFDTLRLKSMRYIYPGHGVVVLTN